LLRISWFCVLDKTNRFVSLLLLYLMEKMHSISSFVDFLILCLDETNRFVSLFVVSVGENELYANCVLFPCSCVFLILVPANRIEFLIFLCFG